MIEIDYLKLIEDVGTSIYNSVCKLIKNAPFDKSFRAQVTKSLGNNKYEVLYKGNAYTVKCKIGLTVGDFVTVCAPQNNWNELVVTENNSIINRDFKKYKIHNAVGISGSTGYVGICRITIKTTYRNSPIRFKISQRGMDGGEIMIRFANANSTDPTLAAIKVYGSLKEVQIVKSSISQWILYVQKSESYDSIDVVDFNMGSYMNSVNIEWINLFSSSSPGGTIATVVWS